MPAMVEVIPGLVPMVFNSGLCFLLAGIGLVLSDPDAQRHRSIKTAIGAYLVTLCSLTVLEHVLDRSMGIDMEFIHTWWYDYDSIRPGRMAPNTAVGFVLIGMTYLLSHRVKTKAVAIGVIVLTFCVLGIGLTGLVGYSLAPDLLFGWSRSARMAIHTASGMLLCGIGLWLWWSRSQWYEGEQFFTEDSKIRFLSAGILILVTITAGLTGFVLLQGRLQETLENRLEAAISRGILFRAMATETASHASAALRLAGLQQTAEAVLTDRGSSRDTAQFDAVASRLVNEGYLAVVVENASKQPVRVIGRIADAPLLFTAPLTDDGKLELVWDGGMVLQIRQDLIKDGSRIGSLRIDRAIPVLEKSLFDMSKLGRTAESGVCVLRREHYLVCLPNSRNPDVFTYDLRIKKGKPPLPMELAVAGKTGVVYTIDYHKQGVVGAHGQLAPGIGLVAKQEVKEAYAVIRNTLKVGVPVMLLVSVCGALLLYSQLNPLVIRIRRSEREADEAAMETQTIVGAVGDGIITIDHQGIIQSVNNAAYDIFGYGKNELEGQNLSVLMPADMSVVRERGFARAAEGGLPRLLGMRNVQVNGLKKSGQEFPLEMTINTVPLSGRKLFVGVMRDITLRKESEERLSRLAQYDVLTGLPNRALFMDRLSAAIARTKRSGSAIVLMFIDLDGFKGVNDAFGHQGGDELLIQVAERLSSVVRKSDTVARLAGDEFTVILENLANPEEDARVIAEKIVNAIRAPFPIGGQSASVTASVGLAIHDAHEGDIEVSELLQHADERMYAAKQGGKNKFSVEHTRSRRTEGRIHSPDFI